MITIRLEGLAELQRNLINLDKQAQYAAAVTLTKTAQQIQADLKAEMGLAFDRPTPYALNSLMLKPATRSRLEAAVWFKDVSVRATPYMPPQVYGGTRGFKPFEKALNRIGVLPQGWYAVPGQGATLDAYGNMSRGQIVDILSFFSAFGEQGYSANMTATTKARRRKGTLSKMGYAYFYVRPPMKSRLHPGVYKRLYQGHETAIRPMLIFVRAATYKPRLRFFEIAQETASKVMQGYWSEALAQAIATAR